MSAGKAVPIVPAHILVVEDDPVQVALISDLLTEQGYRVTVLGTLGEARAAIQAAVPDLLILDRMLPDGDGSQLCEELKANLDLREIPAILLTARDRVEDRVEGLLRGADDYIPKPFHPQEFLARVYGALRTLGLQRELRQKAEELEQKQQTLLATQARLVQAERLGAIGEIGLAIRHEINNPLGTVMGFAELLLANAADMPPDVQKKLEAIYRASLRIRDVVRRLEDIQEDRTVEYIPGLTMTDLNPKGASPRGDAPA